MTQQHRSIVEESRAIRKAELYRAFAAETFDDPDNYLFWIWRDDASNYRLYAMKPSGDAGPRSVPLRRRAFTAKQWRIVGQFARGQHAYWLP